MYPIITKTFMHCSLFVCLIKRNALNAHNPFRQCNILHTSSRRWVNKKLLPAYKMWELKIVATETYVMLMFNHSRDGEEEKNNKNKI
jgi:hypothetical protein